MASSVEIEDGEILSDDEMSNAKKADQVFGNYEAIDRNALRNQRTGNQFQKMRSSATRYSSEEDSASEEEHFSSPIKKPMRSKPDFKPGAPHLQDSTWIHRQHQNIMGQRGKKPNNIWGSVLQEESMSKFVTQLNRNEQVDYSQRGAESYDWTRSKEDPRFVKDDESGSDDSEGSSDTCESNEVGPIDLTDMETFAAASERPRQSAKSRLGKKRRSKKRHSTDSNKSNKSSNTFASSDEDRNELVDMESGELDARDILKNKKNERSHSNLSSHRTDAREKINQRKRTHDQRRFKNRNKGATHMDVELVPMKMGMELNDTMDTMVLADNMREGLHEPPDKLETIINVIEIAGVEKAIKLYKATEDVEEMGGLKIRNGLRRRTPGGVYFFLVREDCDLTQEQKSKIFENSNQEYKQKLKEAKKIRKKAARARKRAEKAGMEGKKEHDNQGTVAQENAAQKNVNLPTEEGDMNGAEDDVLNLEPGIDIELS